MQTEQNENKKHDLNDLLGLLIDQLMRVTHAERALIYLYDTGDQVLWNRAGVGAEIMEIQFKLGDGIPGKVIAEGVAINIEDVSRDNQFDPAIDQITDVKIKNMLVVPIIDARSHKVGVVQLINKKEGSFNERDLQFVEAMAAQAAIGIENTVLYLNLQETRKREEILNEEIRVQNKKLQDAYLQLDEKAKLAETSSKNILRNRTILTVASIILFVILGFFVWRSGRVATPTTKKQPEVVLPKITEDGTGELPIFTVKTEPLYFPLTLSGNLDAVETVNLFAPFTGRITEVNFKIGESVAKGQVLLKLDTEHLESEYRSAQIEMWKARNKYDEVKDWDKGVEMAKARRELQRAQEDLEDKKQTLEKTKELYRLGIISEREWDATLKAEKQAEIGLLTTQESMDATIKKGDTQAVQIELFGLENAELKARDLKEKLDKATIEAPTYGVAIRPVSSSEAVSGQSGRKEVTVEKGVKIDEGSIFVAIADMTRLSVLGRVDELDITSVHAGQDVEITGDAFPGVILKGKVDYVSSQAKTGGTKPYFEIRVTTIPLTKEQLEAVRLGMSATLSINKYMNPKAILIPFSTIRTEPDGNYVYKIVEGEKEPVKTKITRGITTVKSVEVTSGVEAGDRLLILSPTT